MSVPSSEDPRWIVQLLERHVQYWRSGEGALSPEYSSWAAGFGRLRARWRRAIAANPKLESRLSEMATWHQRASVTEGFRHAQDGLKACCRPLLRSLRASDGGARRWDAVDDLTLWPKLDPTGAMDEEEMQLAMQTRCSLTTLIECETDPWLRRLAAKTQELVRRGQKVVWSDREEVEWISKVLPARCDLDRPQPVWSVTGACSPQNTFDRLLDCQRLLAALRMIAEAVEDGGSAQVAKRLGEADLALDELGAELQVHREWNETAYRVRAECASEDASASFLANAAAYLESHADVRRAGDAVDDLRRLTEMLLGKYPPAVVSRARVHQDEPEWLDEVPDFDRKSGHWVSNKEAAELEAVKVRCLANYRSRGSKNEDLMAGMDSYGRVWRRPGTRHSHPWYWLPTLLTQKNASR